MNAAKFVTSFSLVEDLLAQHLTYMYVGTVWDNRQTFQLKCNIAVRGRSSPQFLCLLASLTLILYMSKRNNAVILLSSMHYDKSIKGDEQKPEIITQYIAPKRGVDNRNHLAGAYSVKLISNRCPVVFYNIRDIATISDSAISSYVMWLCNFPTWRVLKRLSHYCFYLHALGEALVGDLVQKHFQNPHALQKTVKSAFDDLVILDVR